MNRNESEFPVGIKNPQSCHEWFLEIIKTRQEPVFHSIPDLAQLFRIKSVIPTPNEICLQTNLLFDFYRCIFLNDSSNKHQELVKLMTNRNFTLSDLDKIPFGIALPLRESLSNCRNNPPHHWCFDEYKLINRDDLAMMCLSEPIKTESFIHHKNELKTAAEVVQDTLDEKIPLVDVKDASYKEIVKLLFSKDDRISQVQSLFDIKVIPTLKIDLVHDARYIFLIQVIKKLLMRSN